ncbi:MULTISPECIES: ABC transporter substrate-binding protein [Agrobacterium]|uniref:ABC transporter substrate-binding protein n=1 Tax=Agrobacterium rosae TaxID=1972867 RepID=A0A1R3TBI5_9HYPH|nr:MULTISPECIES: ABC transporter substrate-binding protein [Agrobacterium]KAA3515420.1 ABC transporter substrate-binding protein [Agrobacterium rosae]KAA3524386.1 ABC transporter substrate-binding protein [Agrobacterium rosae]MBN7804318.1 ABC transporter substrate-binding protein [Agrobacterium rosae]MCM2431289.1 ABC transporter substrate-binding protein [Agrobacterium rosae]MDX8302251.1 ABC transporter substrate-binding protein [Agrobacterium rosae]
MTSHTRHSRLAALALGTAMALNFGFSAHAADEKVSIAVNTMQIFSSLDPAKVTDYTGYMAVVNMYDGLTTVSPSGEVIPHLAKSWEISSDGLTYTFHLRDDVKFQDGTALKAADMVWSIQRLIGINKGPSNLIVGLVKPENITAPDEKTVVIKLDRKFSPFLAITPLMVALNEKLVTANAKPDDKWGEAYVGEHSAGSGPYSLVSYNRSADMVIARNPDYFGGWTKGKPIDEVRFIQTSDDATVKALAEKGDLGLSSHGLGNDTYESIGKMPKYKLIQTRISGGFVIKLNTKTYPTDDIHVRRAIAYATDYKTIQEVIYPGFDMQGPLSTAFKDAHNDGIQPGVFDLEKAKEELAKSKYAGQKITLVNSYVASLAFEAEVALMLQANLEQIGITLDIKPEPWNRIVELSSKAETTPASTQVNISPTYPSPDAMFYNQYHSKASGTWMSMEWLQNPEIDALIDKARGTTDVNEQNATYKELQTKIADLQPDVWAVSPNRRYAANKCLQGYEFIPMQSWDLNFSRFHWDCVAK